MTDTSRPDFTHVYDQQVERIYRYLLARTGSVPEAEDLTSETFRAALEGFARYQAACDDRRAMTAWLIGIARHKLADHFRRGRRDLPLEESLRQPGPTPEEQAGQRLEMARVAAALRRLTSERAEALALYYFGGLSMTEVGQSMGKHEEAVKKLVQRGLADLRAALRER